MYKVYIYCLALLGLISSTSAGPLAYGICQTGCNALAVACYTTAGTTSGIATACAVSPAVIVACQTAQGLCLAGCAAAVCTPTP